MKVANHGQKAWVRMEKSGSSGPVGSVWWTRWLTTSRRYESPAKRKQAAVPTVWFTQW